jgi:hypothetical protein
MAEQIHNFSIANDTANGKINLKELQLAIANSSIVAGFYPPETFGDNLKLISKAELTAGEITLLASLVFNNSGHDSAAEVLSVKVIEEPTYVTVDRTIKTESIELESGESSKQISFPYPVVLLGGEFHCKAENVKDRCQLVVNPDGVVGITEAVIASGLNEINLPATVMPYAFKGYTLKLTDGTNTDNLGEIISTSNQNPLTTENPTTREWGIGTQIIIEYYVIPHIYFDAPVIYHIGKNSNSGSIVQANIPIEFRYFNDNNITKDVKISFMIEYYL